MSLLSRPDPTSRPPSPEGARRHTCGCHSKGVVRLNSVSSDLRSAVGNSDGSADALGTVLDVAVIGGAAYLVYALFFGD